MQIEEHLQTGVQYVVEELQRGVPEREVVGQLVDSGWSLADAQRVLKLGQASLWEQEYENRDRNSKPRYRPELSETPKNSGRSVANVLGGIVLILFAIGIVIYNANGGKGGQSLIKAVVFLAMIGLYLIKNGLQGSDGDKRVGLR